MAVRKGESAFIFTRCFAIAHPEIFGPRRSVHCTLPVAGYTIRTNVSSEAPAMKLKITSIGNSAGVILPKEILARLRLEKGDELYALETPDGLKLSVFDPTLAEQMDVAEQVMREDRQVLHKLAQ
tara:strand:- start:3341 stop:3715 length:375 start_codon:yes stop_codon:yes gene_type:complete